MMWWALLSDWACRMKVRVMLFTCGDPEQAPTVMTAASAAATFQKTERVLLAMTIACLAESVGVKRLPGLGSRKWRRMVQWRGMPGRPNEPDREETPMAIDPNAVGA